MVVERPKPTERNPQHMCLDKGYDYIEIRELIEEWGYTAHINLKIFKMSIEILMIILITGLLVLAFLLRFLPYRLAPGGLGVDQWYWKSYIETYRRDQGFPPDLPQYLLEEHQWYPPLFPLLMAHLPKVVFDRYGHWIAILIDLLRMMLLLGVASWLSDGNLYAVGIAGLVYATTPILISYNIQLNPRGLGYRPMVA
jgi:hypothetical protein